MRNEEKNNSSNKFIPFLASFRVFSGQIFLMFETKNAMPLGNNLAVDDLHLFEKFNAIAERVAKLKSRITGNRYAI